MKQRGFILFALFLVYSIAVAEEKTSDPYNNIAELKQKAKQGDASAQNNLARCYSTGKNVKQDFEEAVYWYRKAAAQGNALAQFNLGLCYDNGQGVERDKKQAIYWYNKAAEQGNASAQFTLGIFYSKGEGVEQDLKQAAYWYSKAAEQGIASAQFNLGLCYSKGEGVEQDYKQAADWYSKAAEQGNASAQFNLGNCYFKGEGVEQDYEQAANWYRKAAQQGDASAQFNLGLCYENGKGVEKHSKQSTDWYRKAAEQGDALAQFNLGVSYNKGEGVEQDFKQAVYWYRKAAEQGNASAQFNLGFCYANGQGIEQDYTQAVYWYRGAAQQGIASAQNNLGLCYSKGQGVKEDYIEAYKYFLLAQMNGQDVSKSKTWLIDKLSQADIQEAQKRANELFEQQATNKKNANESPPIDTTPVPKSTGTAFCIHSDGFFLTASHVLKGENIKVKTLTGLFPATVVFADEGLDIALLKISVKDCAAIPLISSSDATIGQNIFTIGFPNIYKQNLVPEFTEGLISSLNGPRNNPRYFQIKMAAQLNSLGEPLLDEKGSVIGIVNAKLDDVSAITAGSAPQNINYAVKSSLVLPMLDGIKELNETSKSTKLPQEEALKMAKDAVGFVMCY